MGSHARKPTTLLEITAAGEGPRPGRGPESDPKGAAGRRKPTFQNLSPSSLILMGEVMRQGGVKYGPYNWAEERMKASTYYDAIERHLMRWWLGETIDLESGVDAMAHIMSSAMILMEQMLNERLIDDRPKQLSIETWKKAVEMAKAARAKFAELRKSQGLPTGEE